jgi:hypothetical protein
MGKEDFESLNSINEWAATGSNERLKSLTWAELQLLLGLVGP